MKVQGPDLVKEGWDLLAPTTRDTARGIIADLIDRVVDGRSQTLWIEGMAGFGKTACLDDLAEQSVRRGCLVLRAECPFPGEGDLPWERILAAADPPLPLDLIAARIDRETIAELSDIFPRLQAGAGTPPRGSSKGYDRTRKGADPTQPRWRALARLLEFASRRAPIVLAIDDLHRAAPELIQQLRYLMRPLSRAPILWIITADAAEASEEILAFRRTLESLRRLAPLTLGSMTDADLRGLLRDRVQPDDMERLVPWLVEKTAGHPLFVREVLRNLIESEYLAEEGPAESGRLTLVKELEGTAIPPSLEAMMRERLRTLPGARLRVFRALAALGDEESLAAIQTVSGGSRRDTDAALRALICDGLVVPSPSSKGRYRIRHGWLGRVALDAFTDPPPEALSLRAARTLACDTDPPEPARDLRRARALVRAGPEHRLEAITAFEKGARSAWASHLQGAARTQVESGLALLEELTQAETRPGSGLRGEADEKTLRALEERVLELAGTIHASIGPFLRGVEELERLRRIYASKRPAVSRSAWVMLEKLQGQAYRTVGDFDAALACYGRALARLEGKGNERARALVLLEIGWVHYERGDFEQGLKETRSAARVLQRLGATFECCRARNIAGLIVWAKGDFLEALRVFRGVLRGLEPLGTIPLTAAVCNNLGLVYWNLGNLDEATQWLTRTRRIRVAMGELRGEAICLANLALVEEDRGNLESAARQYRYALRIQESLEDRRGIVIELGNLANVVRQTGEIEEAQALAERALAESRNLGAEVLLPGLLTTCSAIHRALGRPAEAMDEARKAVELAGPLHNRRLIAEGSEALARAAADLGLASEARAAMRRAKDSMAAESPIHAATVLASEAEMLLGMARRSSGEADRLIRAARESAERARTIFEQHGLVARIARLSGLLAELGIATPTPAAAVRGLPQRATPTPAVVLASGAKEGDGRTHIRCFGAMQIVTPHGREIGPGDWGSHKARAIFAYLLFNRSTGSGIPRDRILDAIWPEASLDSVENTFHATLALLRRTLSIEGESQPPWGQVVHAGGCYYVSFPTEPWIDCTAFEEGFREGERREGQGNCFRAIAAYQYAESLVHADFLEDSYQGWTDPLRDRYKQDYQDLLLRLGILSLETWKPAEALEWAKRLLACDPFDERACRLAMHSHAALGHRKAALDVYVRFVGRLKADLGAEPEPRTAETWRILRQGASLADLPPLERGSGRSSVLAI